MDLFQIPDDYQNSEISFSTLPSVEELELTPLSPKYLQQMRVQYSLYFLVAILFDLGSWFFIKEWGMWPFLIALILLILWWGASMLWMKKAYQIRGYAFREKDVTYRKGLFFRKTTTIPISRIQQVTVKQTFIGRLFSLHTLQLADASQGGEALSIPGLKAEEAEAMRSHLLSIIS